MPARSLTGCAFDRGRIFHEWASDTEGLRLMWEMMANQGPKLLQVSNLQPYEESIPELHKMQGDCPPPLGQSILQPIHVEHPPTCTSGAKVEASRGSRRECSSVTPIPGCTM